MDRQSSTGLIGSFRYSLVLAGIAVIGVVPGASARVTTLTINDNQPAFSSATFGSVRTYEVITGTFTDEIDPNDPHNAVIVDIEHGPRKPNGTVSFTRISKLSDRPTWRIRHTG